MQADILNALYALDKTKSEEIHFTVGEALSCVASGAVSAAAKDPLHPEIDDSLVDDDEDKQPAKATAQKPEDAKTKQQPQAEQAAEYPEVMADVLTKLFSLLQSGSNLSRNAAAIWLLSLLQHSPTHPELRSKLPLIQAHFSRLLAGKPHWLPLGFRGNDC